MEKFLKDIKKIPHHYLKYILQLRQKKNRYKEKKFLLEGEKSILALFSHPSLQIESLIVHPTFLAKHEKIIQEAGIQNVWLTDQGMLSRMGYLTTNYTAIAVVHMPLQKKIVLKEDSCTLVLDHIQDPGNLGTILRTACWYGIKKIICSANTVDLYNPKVIQSSMGSIAQVDVYYLDLHSFFSKNSLPIWGACSSGEQINSLQFPPSFLLLIGNESKGIHKNYEKYIDKKIGIRKYGYGNSLNAAMATAIICDNWRASDKKFGKNIL